MKLHKGYYLVVIKNGQIHSYDGNHDQPKGVTEASQLINRLGLNPENLDHKMIRLPYNIDILHLDKAQPFSGAMAIVQMLNKQLDLKTFTLDDVPDIVVKLNEEAIGIMAPIIEKFGSK